MLTMQTIYENSIYTKVAPYALMAGGGIAGSLIGGYAGHIHSGGGIFGGDDHLDAHYVNDNIIPNIKTPEEQNNLPVPRPADDSHGHGNNAPVSMPSRTQLANQKLADSGTQDAANAYVSGRESGIEYGKNVGAGAVIGSAALGVGGLIGGLRYQEKKRQQDPRMNNNGSYGGGY